MLAGVKYDGRPALYFGVLPTVKWLANCASPGARREADALAALIPSRPTANNPIFLFSFPIMFVPFFLSISGKHLHSSVCSAYVMEELGPVQKDNEEHG
jgi:hypothetical protein